MLFSEFPSQQAVIQSLSTGERQVLIESSGGDVTYLPTGHLAYVLDGTLVVVPFDVEQRTITGGPVPVVEGVRQEPTGIAQFAHASTARSSIRGAGSRRINRARSSGSTGRGTRRRSSCRTRAVTTLHVCPPMERAWQSPFRMTTSTCGSPNCPSGRSDG